MEIFCSSIPPSKNNFRAKVQKKSMVPSQPMGANFVTKNLANVKAEQDKVIWEEPMNRARAIGSNRITLADNNNNNTMENWQ